tara:strand:+ start:803 stop:970 length:168 start_codon:yes stop_codon:yes gene_type:complete
MKTKTIYMLDGKNYTGKHKHFKDGRWFTGRTHTASSRPLVRQDRVIGESRKPISY